MLALYMNVRGIALLKARHSMPACPTLCRRVRGRRLSHVTNDSDDTAQTFLLKGRVTRVRRLEDVYLMDINKRYINYPTNKHCRVHCATYNFLYSFLFYSCILSVVIKTTSVVESSDLGH